VTNFSTYPQLIDSSNFGSRHYGHVLKLLLRINPWLLSECPARHAQAATGGADGQIAVLESGTGSGKTEAALFRFARLFPAGEVDGLYFARPASSTTGSATTSARPIVSAVLPTSISVQNKSEEARAGFAAARELYDRLGNDLGKANCLCGLAEVAEAQGKGADACAFYTEAKSLYERLQILN
jgi:hypothetical protein